MFGRKIFQVVFSSPLFNPCLCSLLLQALYTNSSIDERGEPAEEEEDHTYELLLTAQTKHPPPSLESQSNKGNCVYFQYGFGYMRSLCSCVTYIFSLYCFAYH